MKLTIDGDDPLKLLCEGGISFARVLGEADFPCLEDDEREGFEASACEAAARLAAAWSAADGTATADLAPGLVADLRVALKAALDGLECIEEQYEEDSVEYRICHRAADAARAALARCT